MLPLHSGGSGARTTGVHVPVTQLSHGALQALLQQAPSLQKPDLQSLAFSQAAPFALHPVVQTAMHAPAPSHFTPLPQFDSGSEPAAYGRH